MRALAPLLLFGLLALAACDTAEERAEAHYQRAVALLAAGDDERAMVEFRNVFRLNGEHIAARLAYAGALRENGEIREAYGQYLRVVEQEPQGLESRLALIELALQVQDFAAAAGSAAEAYAIAPGDPRIRAYKATVDFRSGDRAGAVAMAEGVRRRGSRHRAGADGADRRPALRRRRRRGAGAGRRGAGARPRRREPAPRAPQRARGASATPPAPAPNSPAWPSSSPRTRGCAGR